MNYKHFTIEERCCLREYYIKGKSYREIARLLGIEATPKIIATTSKEKSPIKSQLSAPIITRMNAIKEVIFICLPPLLICALRRKLCAITQSFIYSTMNES